MPSRPARSYRLLLNSNARPPRRRHTFDERNRNIDYQLRDDDQGREAVCAEGSGGLYRRQPRSARTEGPCDIKLQRATAKELKKIRKRRPVFISCGECTCAKQTLPAESHLFFARPLDHNGVSCCSASAKFAELSVSSSIGPSNSARGKTNPKNQM